eukprot:gene4059-5081_t
MNDRDDSDNENETTQRTVINSSSIQSKSSLIYVSLFRNDYLAALEKEELDPILESQLIDLNIDDIRPITYYEMVENEIKLKKREIQLEQAQYSSIVGNTSATATLDNNNTNNVATAENARKQRKLNQSNNDDSIDNDIEITVDNSDDNNNNSIKNVETTTTTTTTTPDQQLPVAPIELESSTSESSTTTTSPMVVSNENSVTGSTTTTPPLTPTNNNVSTSTSPTTTTTTIASTNSEITNENTTSTTSPMEVEDQDIDESERPVPLPPPLPRFKHSASNSNNTSTTTITTPPGKKVYKKRAQTATPEQKEQQKALKQQQKKQKKLEEKKSNQPPTVESDTIPIFPILGNDLIDDVNDPSQLVPLTEVILSVSIYHPNKNLKTMEILVLGSQRLTELRDKIYCLSDTILDGHTRKSGYFFINNTFYNDTRNENNILYSKNIISWLKKNDRDVSEYKESVMDVTTFDMLQISIGEKYVYCHQGNCEHIIVFEQLRLVNKNDQRLISKYPIIQFQMKLRRRKCKVCEIYPAKFVTIGDKMVDETPYFFCEECYRAFHYTKEGVLLYSNYQVFPYYHE